MSVTISGDTGLAGAATGALNGTLGATTPSTVVATTIDGTTETITGPAQSTSAITDAGSVGGTVSAVDSAINGGNGGCYSIGAGAHRFAAIKGLLTSNSNNYAGDLAFSLRRANTDTALTECMRIDSSGNLLVGTTGISVGTFPGIQGVSASGGGGTFLSHSTSGTATRQWGFGHNNSDQFVVYGYNNTTFNTGAYIAWGATSWTASSDERKKDIIEPITDAIDKVSTLRAVIGKYKTDEEGTRRSFLIAQDVLAVLPEAVDATNPDDLGVQYTEVIPLLVAAIKEQQALITSLTARLELLEAK